MRNRLNEVVFACALLSAQASGVLADGSRAGYPNADKAAGSFVDFARSSFPNQRIEYCAYILRLPDGSFKYTTPVDGTPDSCPTQPKPSGAVAAVHTHPILHAAGKDDLSLSGQMFSENDFLFTYRPDINLPIYLGAPAGHVLRYAPGASECRGDMVRHGYTTVRGPKPGASGVLLFKSSEFVYIKDGKKQAYCRAGKS